MDDDKNGLRKSSVAITCVFSRPEEGFRRKTLIPLFTGCHRGQEKSVFKVLRSVEMQAQFSTVHRAEAS